MIKCDKKGNYTFYDIKKTTQKDKSRNIFVFILKTNHNYIIYGIIYSKIRIKTVGSYYII